METSNPADLFSALKQRDVLVHHPYDSFSTSVQRFIEQAAADLYVLKIKQTLYRTSGDSPIVDALIDAAEAGKQVLVLVEIKARFDEQANIRWARKLEQAGCHVVYGVIGFKTHCKLSMVVRQEPDGLRRYAHLGTGNYHPKTARLYEDLGLLTADPSVTEDVAHLFNHLSGFSRRQGYRRLLVAPHSIRAGLIERIHREVEHHQEGRPARIRFKLNSLVDEAICDALYRASQAGVPVDLWIRGICTIRPGVAGLSDKIRTQHPRPVPGAQPGVLVHQRRRTRGRDRVRGPDAPQPGPPGGDPGAAQRARSHHGARRPVRPRFRPRHGVVVAAAGRYLGGALTGPDGSPLRDLQERLIATRGRRRQIEPIS